MNVIVFKHPGLQERVKGVLIPGLHNLSSDRNLAPVSAVRVGGGDVRAFDSRHVFTPEGLAYAQEWATKTHASVFDIRVPDALAVR